MISLKKTVIFSIALSLVSLVQANKDVAYQQGERLAQQLMDFMILKAKNNEAEALKYEAVFKRAQSSVIHIHEKESFARGVVAGLNRIQVKQVVKDQKLSQDQHAGVLVAYYMFQDSFTYMSKNPHARQLSEVETQALMVTLFKSVLRGFKEVYGINSTKYKQLEVGLNLMAHSIKDAVKKR